MRYAWRNLSFEAPDARDESTVLLMDRADPPAFNLTRRVDELLGGPAATAALPATTCSFYPSRMAPSAGR